MYLVGIGVVHGGGPHYSSVLEYDTVWLPVFRRNLLSVFRIVENQASRLLENIDSHQTKRWHISEDLHWSRLKPYIVANRLKYWFISLAELECLEATHCSHHGPGRSDRGRVGPLRTPEWRG